MRIRLTAFVAGLALIVAARPAGAHHSFNAEYDADKPAKLKGAVTKVEWKNPHAFFYIDVTEENGKVANWSLELTSPNALMRAGWTRNTMKIGDEVMVDGSRAKDGSNHANVRAVTLASTGQKLFSPSSQGETPGP